MSFLIFVIRLIVDGRLDVCDPANDTEACESNNHRFGRSRFDLLVCFLRRFRFFATLIERCDCGSNTSSSDRKLDNETCDAIVICVAGLGTRQ